MKTAGILELYPPPGRPMYGQFGASADPYVWDGMLGSGGRFALKLRSGPVVRMAVQVMAAGALR